METADVIGTITGGGLKEGFRIRLTVPAERVQEGSFIVCDGGRYRYYGLATDLQLGATDPRFADEQRLRPNIAGSLLGQPLYTILVMYPTLMLDRGPELGTPARVKWEEQVDKNLENPGPKPVKTVPAQQTIARLANAADVAQIFGEAGPGLFTIGHTIEQNFPVRLDLNRFVKRSSGIFGATGTGKSFLTRIVLAGLMRENVAAALVFDMHNEYAFDSQDPDSEQNVRGLKTLFGGRVQVAALGRGSLVGSHVPDFTLELALSDFEISDIRLLADALDLTDTADVTLNALVRSFKAAWFSEFMKLDPGAVVTNPETGKSEPANNSVAAWAGENNVHVRAAEALHRRLKLIYDRPYIVDKPASNAVAAIVNQLENGRHVILSFGKFDRELDYLLVSNILTRRIREHWVKRTEDFRSRSEPAPRPLAIVVEEAHKLLSPSLSGQTAFGTIARELRKYFVTLIVIDQRPSGIDDEVMSQLGTRITGWLGDEDDIRAVLTGLAGRDQLRGMLARLQEKEEVLLLGWGVKMPIPVKSRRYNEAFFVNLMKEKLSNRGRTFDELELDDTNELLGLGE